MRVFSNLLRALLALAAGWVCGAVLLAAVQVLFADAREIAFPLRSSAALTIRAWVLVAPLLAVLDPQRRAFRSSRAAAAAGAMQGVLLLAATFPFEIPRQLMVSLWLLHFYVAAAIVGGVAFAIYYYARQLTPSATAS